MIPAPDDRTLVVTHEAAHFLAAHLLGVEVGEVRVGRLNNTDRTCGAVKLTAPQKTSDADWSLIASAGYGAQLALGLPLFVGQAGGDIALLEHLGLEPQFLLTGRWILSERVQLEALIRDIERISMGGDALVEGSLLHEPRASTYGSRTAAEVCGQFE